MNLQEIIHRVFYHILYSLHYLAYHETPFIEQLSHGFDGTLLIDANGLLHPRKCGLATFAGVIMGRQTIGVAKSLLMGKPDNEGYIIYDKILGELFPVNSTIPATFEENAFTFVTYVNNTIKNISNKAGIENYTVSLVNSSQIYLINNVKPLANPLIKINVPYFSNYHVPWTYNAVPVYHIPQFLTIIYYIAFIIWLSH